MLLAVFSFGYNGISLSLLRRGYVWTVTGDTNQLTYLKWRDIFSLSLSMLVENNTFAYNGYKLIKLLDQREICIMFGNN